MNLREWALPVYTIMIQLALGVFISLWVIRTRVRNEFKEEDLDRISQIPLLIIFSTIAVGILGAHFHLSKPFLSVFAVLNIQSSWLSREVFFTVIFFLLTGFAVFFSWFDQGRIKLQGYLGWAAISSGLITVYCMSQIYLLPTQITWDSPTTVLTYLGSVFVLGPPSLLVIFLMDHRFSSIRDPGGEVIRQKTIRDHFGWLTSITALGAILILALNYLHIDSLSDMDHPSAQASLELLLGLYQPLLILRFGLLLLGGGQLFVWWHKTVREKIPVSHLIGPVYLACALILVGEILGRFLFYASHVRVGI